MQISSQVRALPTAELPVVIHLATGMAKETAEITASYALAEAAPAYLHPACLFNPQVEFSKAAAHLSIPDEERLPAFFEQGGTTYPLKFLSLDGFDLTVELPSIDKTYMFDATNFSFGFDYRNPDANYYLATNELVTARMHASEAARGALTGRAMTNPDNEMSRVHALISIRSDLRPAVVVANTAGEETRATMRDVRGNWVLLDVSEGPRMGLHLFDMRKGDLNFSVDSSDAAAYGRFQLARRQASAAPGSMSIYRG